MLKSQRTTMLRNDRRNSDDPRYARTRRQLIAGALAFGGLAFNSRGRLSAQELSKTPGTAENQKRTSLHQEVDFKASPQRIYEALLDAKQFAAMTGMSAEIDPKAGGAFSTFGGLIVGRNIELTPNQRIVQ